MEFKTIIFNSELELRDYVIRHSKGICQIVLFEDILDSTIFFYWFYKERLIIAAKESSQKNFSSFLEKYNRLASEHNFNISSSFNQMLSGLFAMEK